MKYKRENGGKVAVCFLLFFAAVSGFVLSSARSFAYTPALETNNGITYPVSLETGLDEKGKNVFPDHAFLASVRQGKFTTGKYSGQSFDLDGDGSLSKEECETVRVIRITGQEDIGSIRGIEAFPKLRELYCSHTGVQEINVSKNPRLQILSCAQSPVRTLDIRGCGALRELNVSGCCLAALPRYNS